MKKLELTEDERLFMLFTFNCKLIDIMREIKQIKIQSPKYIEGLIQEKNNTLNAIRKLEIAYSYSPDA